MRVAPSVCALWLSLVWERGKTQLRRAQQALKTIDVDNSGKMALIEYLVFKYKKSVSETNSAPQVGDAPMPRARLLIGVAARAGRQRCRHQGGAAKGRRRAHAVARVRREPREAEAGAARSLFLSGSRLFVRSLVRSFFRLDD